LTGSRNTIKARSGVKDYWMSSWYATAPGVHRYYFEHNMGIIPTDVEVYVASHNDGNTAHPISDWTDHVFDTTSVPANTLFPDLEQGSWVGYAITEKTKDRITIVWADWMAYSEQKDSRQWSPEGWLQLGVNSCFFIRCKP